MTLVINRPNLLHNPCPWQAPSVTLYETSQSRCSIQSLQKGTHESVPVAVYSPRKPRASRYCSRERSRDESGLRICTLSNIARTCLW